MWKEAEEESRKRCAKRVTAQADVGQPQRHAGFAELSQASGLSQGEVQAAMQGEVHASHRGAAMRPKNRRADGGTLSWSSAVGTELN